MTERRALRRPRFASLAIHLETFVLTLKALSRTRMGMAAMVLTGALFLLALVFGVLAAAPLVSAFIYPLF